jgi:hypothetical protein
VKTEADWPRYMKAKRLAGGKIGYYWTAHERDRAGGFTLKPEALGNDYDAAKARAALLNSHLDAWREGKDVPPELRDDGRVGTIDWWHQQHFNSEPFKALSSRTQSDYRNALASIANLPTKITDATTGEKTRTGTLQTRSLSQAAADKIYKRLRRDGAVTRQADYAIDVARRAWKVARRQHPGLFLVPVTGPDGRTSRLAINPFEGVERASYEKDTAQPATREQVLAFAKVCVEHGHAALGVAALICFEWHQRPEDVRKGRITWTDYRPADRPDRVLIFHHKTRKRVWKALDAHEELDGKIVIHRLYPELEEMVAALPKLGVPMVMFRPQRGPKTEDGLRLPRLYSEPYAQHLVQQLRKVAKLPAHFTLEACRHGGMTELGDAELTEQEIMTLSTHATPNAARIYVKRTERQELAAASKRRAYVDRSGTKKAR